MDESYHIFQSDNPKEPSLEDNFRMDLTATLNHKSVADMMEHIDANEYAFWFEKYKRGFFGPFAQGYYLAQIACVIANANSKKTFKVDDLLLRLQTDPYERQDNTTCRLFYRNQVRYFRSKGYDDDVIAAMAKVKTDEYRKNLKLNREKQEEQEAE